MDFRIDVSSEAGSRFDQSITGFRAEEDFGFNAEPYVRADIVQKVPWPVGLSRRRAGTPGSLHLHLA